MEYLFRLQLSLFPKAPSLVLEVMNLQFTRLLRTFKAAVAAPSARWVSNLTFFCFREQDLIVSLQRFEAIIQSLAVYGLYFKFTGQASLSANETCSGFVAVSAALDTALQV